MGDVGRPERVEIGRDEETGVVSFEMYDSNGLCVGGAEFHPNGKVVWTLLRKSEVLCGTDEVDQ